MILPKINARLYKCFIHNTITNELFHIVFILLEYILGIFPLILSSTNQIFYLHQQYKYSYIENSFALMSKIKFCFFIKNNNNKVINSLYLFPFILFFLLSTIFFFILNHYYSKKDKYSYIDIIIVTFYNVFLFRYVNFFFIDIEIYSTLNLFLADDKNITSVLCGLFLCCHCFLTIWFLFYYVDNFSLYLNIKNKEICNTEIVYPFGTFVIKYENANLIFKILLSISNNALEINRKKVTFFVLILNVLSLILSIYNSISFVVRYLFRTINVFSIMTWIKSNTLRKIILLFTFFIQLFTLCFKKNSIQNQSIMMFMSLMSSIFTVSYFIDKKFIYQIIKQPGNNLCDLLIFLMSIETPYHPCLDNSENMFEHHNDNIHQPQTFNYKSSLMRAITSLFGVKPPQDLSVNLKNNQHINISKNKKSDEKWIELFNSLVVNHINQCDKGINCEICRKMKKKDKQYTLYQIMIWFFREKNREKRSIEFNQNSANNEYILQIMYSKIRKDIYNTIKFYIMFLHDESLNVSCCLSNSMTLLFDAFMETSQKQANLFLQLSIKLCEFSKDLKSLLHKYLNFINEDLYTKTADRVIDISTNMTDIKDRFFSLYNQFDKKENLGIHENGHKLRKTRDNYIRETRKNNLFSVLKFQFTLERFVIESMLNQPYEKLSALNIEVLDEFLDNHYLNDKMCILDVKLHNSRNNQLQIVKLTGFPRDNSGKRMFYEYFPKQIRDQGIDELLNKIKHFCKENNFQKDFDFVIEREGFIEYFKYNFEIAELLIKETILIYGNYSKLYDNILLLNFSKCHSMDHLDQVEICHFSETVGKLLLIKPEYIDAINQSNSFKLGLGHFFREISSDDSPRSIIVHEINPENITCFLDYFHLKLKLEPLLGSLSSCYYNNDSDEKESFNIYFKQFRETISKFTSRPSKKDNLLVKQISHHQYFSIKKVYLTKIMDLNKHYVLYNVNVPVEKRKRRNSVLFTGSSRNTNNESFKNNNESQMKTNIEFDNDFIRTGTDSLEQNSISSTAMNSYGDKEKVEEVTFEIDNIIKRESKRSFVIKLTTLIHHIFLFICCFIFLMFQVLNINELKLMTNIFFKFTILKADFNNIFCTFLSLLCISDLHPDYAKGDNNKCFNPMKNFTENHLKYSYLQNYSIIDYFLFENKKKVEYISNNYYELTEIIYTNKFEQLDTLFQTNITLISLQQMELEILQINTYVPFIDALKMYFSSMRLIFQTKEKGIGYEELPISLITFQNKTLVFNDLLHKHTLSLLQIEIYLKLINSIHFADVFNSGEKIIKDKLFFLRNLNVTLTWIFIFFIIILNCVITYLNNKNINITYELYCQILLISFMKLEEEETKSNLNSKLESLITISQLYSKKPTPLINNVLSIQRETAQKFKKTHKTLSSKLSVKDSIEENKINVQTKESQTLIINSLLEDKNYTMKHFYIVHIRHLFCNNIFSSILNISVTIIIYVILILNFEEIFGYFDYALTILTYSSLIYTDTSLIHIKVLLNISDVDYVNLLAHQVDISEEDTLTEQFLKETLYYYTLKMKAATKNNIVDPVTIIPTQCREFYEEIKDFVFESFKTEYNISNDEMLDFLTSICEFEKLMNLNSLSFSFENTFTMMSFLDSKYNNTMNGLVGFLNDSELYHIYINVFFFLRPYFHYFEPNILTPTILGKFRNYLIIVWIFLVINILFECLSFIVNKFFVVKHLDVIKQYLIQFEKCIY